MSPVKHQLESESGLKIALRGTKKGKEKERKRKRKERIMSQSNEKKRKEAGLVGQGTAQIA